MFLIDMYACSTTYLATTDLSVGGYTLIGPGFPTAGQWNQWGFDAIISSQDRCNLLFSLMINAASGNTTTVVIGVDMSSGELAFAYPFAGTTLPTIGYYAGPPLFSPAA